MPQPKFAVANGSSEAITALPAGIEDGENVFEQAIKLSEARKAEAARVNAERLEVDVEPSEMGVAFQRAEAEKRREATTEENSSVEVEPAQPEPAKPAGPYPVDMPLFSFTFSSGVKVDLPLKIEQPPTVWFWENSDLPLLPVTWRWMNWAKVPKSMQRKIVSQHDIHTGEYIDCFNAWIKALNGGATLGE